MLRTILEGMSEGIVSTLWASPPCPHSLSHSWHCYQGKTRLSDTSKAAFEAGEAPKDREGATPSQFAVVMDRLMEGLLCEIGAFFFFSTVWPEPPLLLPAASTNHCWHAISSANGRNLVPVCNLDSMYLKDSCVQCVISWKLQPIPTAQLYVEMQDTRERQQKAEVPFTFIFLSWTWLEQPTEKFPE